MKTLNLTEVQIEVLYDILLDTCQSIEDDLIVTEDEQGNEVEEKIEDYEAFKIYQKLINLKEVDND
mgnify:CR=1 FL=1|tara:strand:- start:151 stop:348 length:198 start_codon:yes stop_codon:yes gene_type:complete